MSSRWDNQRRSHIRDGISIRVILIDYRQIGLNVFWKRAGEDGVHSDQARTVERQHIGIGIVECDFELRHILAGEHIG